MKLKRKGQKLGLLTFNHHLCVQVNFLSGDEVPSGASVGSRVSDCQVAKQQD